MAVFDQYMHLATYLGNDKDRTILLSNANRNSYAIYRMVSFPMILSDPRSEIFNDTRHEQPLRDS